MNEKHLIPVIVFSAALLLCFWGSNFLLDKLADKVIERLQRDYVPGAYSPGLDPDKVDPRLLKVTPAEVEAHNRFWQNINKEEPTKPAHRLFD